MYAHSSFSSLVQSSLPKDTLLRTYTFYLTILNKYYVTVTLGWHDISMLNNNVYGILFCRWYSNNIDNNNNTYRLNVTIPCIGGIWSGIRNTNQNRRPNP